MGVVLSDFSSQCTIVLKRTHIWDAPLLLHFESEMPQVYTPQEPKELLCLWSFGETGCTFGWNIWWILDHLDSGWSKSPCGKAIYFCLQNVRLKGGPVRTCCVFCCRSCGEAWRNPQLSKTETSDNEALYCRLPSPSFSLQWLIQKVLHCAVASRCEGEYNTLCRVAVIFAASTSLYCMDSAGLDLDRLCQDSDSILCSGWPLPSPSPSSSNS